MAELLLLEHVGYKSKLLLLKALKLNSDGVYVLDKNGNRIMDKYIEEPVEVANMLILPGSTIVLDNNPLSLAMYMEEYGEVL